MHTRYRLRQLPILLLVASMVATRVLGTCPDASLILPCTCEQEENVPSHVRCSGFSNIDELQAVIDNSADFQFYTLTIEDSTLPHLNASWFELKQIGRLELRNSTLISLFETPPTSVVLPKVEWISLSDSLVLRRLRWEDMMSFVRLQYLYVSGSEVYELKKGFKEYVSSELQELHLIRNKITTLEGGVLGGKVNLRRIHVSQNGLTTLENSYFEDQKQSLFYLDFSYNPIESIPGNLFEGFQIEDEFHGFYFHLNGTKIRTIPKTLFSGTLADSLRWFYFEDNPLECNCQMKWIPASKNIRLYGTCASPSTFKSKQLTDLREEDFASCPSAPQGGNDLPFF